MLMLFAFWLGATLAGAVAMLAVALIIRHKPVVLLILVVWPLPLFALAYVPAYGGFDWKVIGMTGVLYAMLLVGGLIGVVGAEVVRDRRQARRDQ